MNRTVLDRLLLGATGLFCLLLGAWCALHGFAGSALPGLIPQPGDTEHLLSAGRLSSWRRTDWWQHTAIAAPALLTLCFLGVLFAQLRSTRPRFLPLPRPWVRLRTSALERAVSAGLDSSPDVAGSRVRVLRARRGLVRVRLVLRLAPHAEPARLLRRLADGELEQLRSATGCRDVRLDVRLRQSGRRRGGRLR